MLLKEFEFLQSILSFIDFAHVSSLFLGHHDKALKQKSTIQQNKFNNLFTYKKPQHDPKELFFIILAMFYQKRKSLFLRKVENLSFRQKKLNLADYLVNFELFNRDICNLHVLSTEDLDFIKTKTNDIALSSYCTYNNNVPNIYQKNNLMLSKIKQIVIQKSGRGNSIVIVDRDEYVERMENF